MAAFRWRHWWWVVAVLLLPSAPDVDCRNVTHEDIRDVMLSLVNIFRTSEDKLERHEYREKALGDQLKKNLASLEKKHRALEPLKGMISRLDERLSNVETILLQKEEREKATQKKTNDALEAIQRSLEALTGAAPAGKSAPLDNNLTTNDDALTRRLDLTDTKLDAVKQEIESLKNSLSQDALRAMCLSTWLAGSSANPLEKHISEAEKLLNKYEVKLNEYNGNASKVQTDFVPLSEVSLADEAWHSKMTDVMARQEGEIQKIQRLLSDAEGLWKDLPRRDELQQASNQTLAAVQLATESLKDSDDKSVSKVSRSVRELGDRLAAANEDVQRVLTQGNIDSERAYNHITKSYDALRTELQSLSRGENVLLQTADNVLATRKRIEYGVHQILLEVGELIKTQGNNLNNTIHDRFDGIESTIVEKQSSAMFNLSAKIESEMAQVWRQIGVVYQQLTASKSSLDKLTEQTELYVNGSATTMDNMRDKVGLITSRMVEVDDNLNYLLGRLSLVTQEFSQVRAGLGQALDQVRSSLHTVQDNLGDAGPGPHNITSAEST